MTTTTHTRPQVRYPGQAAAPPGPVDMTMMYVTHHAFRRDLGRFAAAVPHTPLEDRATWRRLAARWEIFAMALHHHHRAEDAALWPLLLDRAEGDERTMLEAMEAEHAEIDPILEACHAGFARLAEHADADARAALTVRVVAGRQSLARHLGHEETDAIAMMQRVMTDAEWTAMVDEHFRATPPPRLILTLVPWLVDDLPGDDRRALLAYLPAPMRLLYALGRRGFARSERRTFAYAL